MPLFRPQLHANLTDVTSDQHHARAHDHSSALDGATLSPAGGVNFSSQISPAALTASVNDYNPNGGDTAFIWHLTTNGSNWNITGIVAPAVAGAMHWIANTHATANITLVHASASSAAANRLNLPNLTNIIIGPYDSVLLVYSGQLGRWRALGT